MPAVTLDQLHDIYREHEHRYLDAIASAPPVRQRTMTEQSILDGLCDAMQAASRAHREAKRADFWKRHAIGARETREKFPWLEIVK